MSKVSRVEVIQTGARRRWTMDEKRRIVAESESGPRRVSVTARRYGLLPSQLFSWRRLTREGRLGAADQVGFVRAVIASEAAPGLSSAGIALDRIEVVLADGVRLIVAAAVDPATLARIIGALERR
jgi:transposase